MAAHTAMPGDNNVEVFEHWSYTVKTRRRQCRHGRRKTGISACDPGGRIHRKEAMSVSDNSFTEGLIINGLYARK